MSNPYFRAKILWEAGQREEGLATLNDYLERELGQPVFRPPSRVFRADSLAHWEAAFVVLFCNSDALVAPFCRVFPLIWKLYPSQHAIVMLLGQDFAREPDIPDYLAEIEGLEAFDYRHTQADFATVADILAESARQGLLRPDPDEHRRTGVACLPIDHVQAVSHGAWEPLGELLLEHLPKAYMACPPDFWQRQATADPLGLVARMLQAAFGAEHPTLQTSRMHLERIVLLAPEYRDALVQAIGQLLTSTDPATLVDLVQCNANIPQMHDARTWLQLLQDGLQSGQFDALVEETRPFRS